MMGKERERGTRLTDIRADHRTRYEWARRMIAARAQKLGWTACQAIDLFCGNGYGSWILTQDSTLPLWVVGFDKSEEAIEEGREHWCDPNVTLVPHDMDTEAPMTWQKAVPHFHAIVCFESLEHVPAAGGVLEYFQKVIRPDGLLLLSVPNEAALPFSKEAWPYHYRHYTEAEIVELVTSFGFNPCVFGQTGLQIFQPHQAIEEKPHHHIVACEVAR